MLARSFVRGIHGTAIIVVALAAFGSVSAHRAQRGQGSVSERVNAVQPYDERDAQLTAESFALLGMTVLAAQTVVFFVTLAMGHPAMPELVRLIAISALGIIATEIAVRRS